MSVQKINPDTYVGNTEKQLKDIKTNADNISSNTTNINNISSRVSNLESVEWRKVYSSRKTKAMSAWASTKITDMQNHSGSGSTYLEANASGIKVKKACTVLVYIQGTANFPTYDCGIRIFQNNSQMYESYSTGYNGWTFYNCFGVLNCNAGDIITLAYMCGITGTYEYLDNTSIIGVVLK